MRGSTGLSVWKIAVGVVALAAMVTVALLSGALHTVQSTFQPIAMNVVYTAPTSVDSAAVLPASAQETLRRLGAAHRSIRLTRIDSTGDVTSRTIDLTPRVKDEDPRSDPLVDPTRVSASLTRQISAITDEVNTAASTGGHSLYQGLTKADLDDAPVMILSSGLDTSSPDDLRIIRWGVPPETLVSTVRDAGELARLPKQPVTFVVLPSSPAQPQLRAVHKTFLRSMWTNLLTASGSTSVTFVDADPANATSAPTAGAPASPVVDLTVVPSTPQPIVTPTPTPSPLSTPTHTTTQKRCNVSGALFVINSPVLIDEEATVAQLRSCTAQALQVRGSTWELDGWTSADTDAIPVPDDAGRRQLSDQRVAVVADLIVTRLGVAREQIIRMTGHGNTSQPSSPPSSPSNRLVRVTITIPAH